MANVLFFSGSPSGPLFVVYRIGAQSNSVPGRITLQTWTTLCNYAITETEHAAYPCPLQVGSNLRYPKIELSETHDYWI